MGGEFSGKGIEPTPAVGSDTAGDDEADAAVGTCFKKSGESFEGMIFFESGMHGAHDDAIFEGKKAEVERLGEVGEGVQGGTPSVV